MRNEMVVAILWRNDELEFPTRDLHIYFSKLTKERTKKQSFVNLKLIPDLKPENAEQYLMNKKACERTMLKGHKMI